MAEPGDPDAIGECQARDTGADRVDTADDLVAGNDRRLRMGQFAIQHMEVRAADPASEHLDPDLPRPRLAIRHLGPDQRRLRLAQDHGLHPASVSACGDDVDGGSRLLMHDHGGRGCRGSVEEAGKNGGADQAGNHHPAQDQEE
jgi:hypothetical protein